MHWAREAIIYHLYPLGALGAPPRNDFRAARTDRLAGLHDWLDPIIDLGATAIQLGPVFESSAHGYDTADYFNVDRRLGDCAALAHWSEDVHRRGLRLILDGVFHHTGRDFWAFRDVQRHGAASRFVDWFFLDFRRSSPYGDPFTYQGWHGHYDLVKLNTAHPEVRAHLFAAVRHWVETFGVDGLRLDAADALDRDFQQALAAFCRALRPDFWLLGEVVAGDYRRWVNPQMLNAVTNYELYKALYSSHNDHNYFELAYTLKRQFAGETGLYHDLALVAFADNHDVDRIASRLTDAAHLRPLTILLFTVPGIPALYYGSEWGISGRRLPHSDAPLRPALTPVDLARSAPHPELRRLIQRLVALRRNQPALRHGSYRPVQVAGEQFVFQRELAGEPVTVAVNAAARPVELPVALPGIADGRLVDLLDGGEPVAVSGGRATLRLPASSGQILRRDG